MTTKLPSSSSSGMTQVPPRFAEAEKLALRAPPWLNYSRSGMVETRLSDWMSVAEAAAALGVTPRRVNQLVAAGALRAERIGNRALVKRLDVEARADLGPAGGRAYSPGRAWALILLAVGQRPPALDHATVSRLRGILRRQSLWQLRARLGSRAERRDFRAHSSDLGRIAAEDGVVRTGPRFAHEAGLSLVAADAPVELYVDERTAARVVRRYALQQSDDPNVVLRVVPSDVRGWLVGSVAPRTAVALDLADDRDARSQDVAREVLAFG